MDGCPENQQAVRQIAPCPLGWAWFRRAATARPFPLTLVWMGLAVGWCNAQTPAALSASGQLLVRAADVYDEASMATACRQLVAQRHAAYADLAQLLRHSNSVVRWKAVEVCGQQQAFGESLGRTATQQLQQQLLQLAEDADADVRGASVLVLSQWYPRSDAALAAIKPRRTDDNSVVQANAWFALWGIEQDARSVHALVKLLSSRDWMAAEQAERHLLSLGKASYRPLVAATQATLASKQATRGEQRRHVRTLARCARTAENQKFLASLTEHAELEIVQIAADELAAYGRDDLGALHKLLRSADHARQSLSIRAIAKLEQISPALQAEFVELLDTVASPALVAAIEVYPQVSQPSKQVIVRYQELLGNRNADLRGAAVSALRHWPGSREKLSEQVQQLAEDDPQDAIRQAARRTLAHWALPGRS